MGFLDWFDKLIDRRVERALCDKSEEIDEEFRVFRGKITATTERLDRLSNKGAFIEQALFSVSGAISIKENIDTIMLSTEWLRRVYWNYSEHIKAKTFEYNPSVDGWREKSFTLEVSKNKKFCAIVVHGIGIGIKAIKFIEGDGYGKYKIFKNGICTGFFVKRKKGNEDGALFINQPMFFRESDLIEIKQESGKGNLKAELLIIVAGNCYLFSYENYLNVRAGSQ